MFFATKNKKNIKGVTLIELLIVSGVIMILGGIGVSTYINQQRFGVLRNTAEEITSYLHSARQKAITQQEGLNWGVRFENPTGVGNDFYALFSGTSFTSARERAPLSDFLEFSNPVSASSTDIVFEKMSGRLRGTVNQSVGVRIIGTNNIAIITVNREGVISRN